MSTQHIGTKNNRERTGNRNELALSGIVREIPDVRHGDLDKFQTDTKGRFELFIEATSSKQYKATRWTRAIAEVMGAYSMLLRHEWEDVDHEFPVDITIWNPEGQIVLQETEVSWDRFLDMCELVHRRMWEMRES